MSIVTNRVRVLSGLMAQAVEKKVTQPGYLCEIQKTSLIRLSNHGTVEWNDQIYVQAMVRVDSLTQSGNGVQPGTLTLDNADNALSTILLQEGIEGMSCKLWVFDKLALGDLDPLLVFDGSVDEVTAWNTQTVTLSLLSSRAGVNTSPRQFISPATGFNFITPRGTTLTINGESIVLE